MISFSRKLRCLLSRPRAYIYKGVVASGGVFIVHSHCEFDVLNTFFIFQLSERCQILHYIRHFFVPLQLNHTININETKLFVKMNKIVSKTQFSEKVFRLEVEAPLIARARRVVQTVGYSTTKLCRLGVGDYITDVVGPLGQATHIERFGTVVCAGGGVGVAPMLPIIKALKEAGNRVISVLAGRTKELIILEDEVRRHSDEVIIMTDDGSYGQKGLVTAGIEQVILREKPCHHDEVLLSAYQEIRDTDRRVAQHHHGRWYRHVWSMPRDGRRQDTLRVCRRT